MKNRTITLDEKTLEDACAYASKLGTSFNSWVYNLIRKEIRRSSPSSMNNLLTIADEISGNSKGQKWTRDDIYER